MAYKVAVVGATGNVGREILQIMAEREFPAGETVALASERSVGVEISFGEDETLNVGNLADYDFTGTDIVLSSPGAVVSAKFSPKAAAAGAVVVDNTSQFRMHPDVPLVIPEVNPEAIAGFKKRGIIANPNCSTIQLVVALKPLHDLAPIKRVVVATYQSTSGAGKEAMDELFEQTRGVYANQPFHKFRDKFTKQIAFNVIPHIDDFMDDGATASQQLMSRADIEKEVWGEEMPESDSLRVHIHSLRAALDKPFGSKMIQTRHGIGYRLMESNAVSS